MLRAANGLVQADTGELNLLFQALPPHHYRAVHQLSNLGYLSLIHI